MSHEMVDSAWAYARRNYCGYSALNHEESHSTITIVGVGNRFCGDDAVGPVIVEQLTQEAPVGVRIFEIGDDQTELIELMRATDAMIIVDAVQASAPAGTIFRLDMSQGPAPQNFFFSSTHGLDVIHTVELARTMGMLPRYVFIYGVAGKSFSRSSRLSAEVREVTDIVVARILNEIDMIFALL